MYISLKLVTQFWFKTLNFTLAENVYSYGVISQLTGNDQRLKSNFRNTVKIIFLLDD